MQEQVVCECKASFGSFKDLKTHIMTCEPYLRKCFFYNSLDRISKQTSKNQLQLISAQLQVTLEKIRDRLYSANHDHKQPQRVTHNMTMQDQQVTTQGGVGIYSSDILECLGCRGKFYAAFNSDSLFYVWDCCHLFCKPCMAKYIDKEFANCGGNLPCPSSGCPVMVQRQAIISLIGVQKFNNLENKMIKKNNNIISCASCNADYFFESGKQEALQDGNGKPLTKEMEKHYAENRFNCANCKTEQCKSCSVIPYHIGKSCEQFKAHADALKCRYCLDVMTEKNSQSGIKAFEDICKKKECKQEAKKACSKVLTCGHPCRGFAGQRACLPCLSQPCCNDNQELMGQKGEDYCAICYVESLDSSPCVRSVCGHIFHFKCLAKRFQIKWIGPRILFNFCVCPLCKKWIQLPEDNPLTNTVAENFKIYEKIRSKCAQRLKFQGCQKDPKLTDPTSPYFQKPIDYAMAIFAYYMCYKCKEPYFGGRKACQNAMQQNQGEFNQKELICSNCCEIPIQNCEKHGKEYIEFKCKFCCSVSQWFCWGNTHFCQSCHNKQCKGEYVSKYTKDKLPKCEGPGKCPVGGDHQGNGEQKAIGCAICRNIKQNGKNF